MIRHRVVAACALCACAAGLSRPVFAQTDALQSGIDAPTLALVVPRSAGASPRIPGDLELQRRHAKIGRIDIEVDDVFEDDVFATGQRLTAPYRLANALHISTKADTIAEQLLFRSGDEYDRRVLDETARLLRGQRYLNGATITPVRWHDDNTVDVVVRVHDVWTLSPGFSFGRKGGVNSTRVEFEDTNFLGWGKQVSLSRASDVDRTSWRLAYADPNLLGTWWRLGASHAQMSDGGEDMLSLSRPFYSLDTRWSFGVNALDTESTQSRYSLGHVADRFDAHRQLFDVSGGISEGLRDGRATRYLAGLHYENRDFTQLADTDPASAPQDRTLAYPWVGVEIIEDQYLTTRNLDQIGRTEDLHIGRSARFEAGFSSTSFGSTFDGLILSGKLQAGAEPGEGQYIINTLGLSGRVESGRLNDALVDVGTRYYRRQSPRRVLFAAASASAAKNLDAEEQLLLGGDNGLRGYPLRYQAGTARALLTLEERLYTDWQPLKLFNVGAAAFIDAGRTWGSDPVGGESLGWLTDVGVGLRLGSARSGLGNVLHVDLAMPLNGGRDIDSVQLLIETRRSF